jgi:glycosyltransferase involved in cell wall biosynthesis
MSPSPAWHQPRVTIISREYPPVTVGGTSTVARNLAVGLADNGWRVTVVSTDPGEGAAPPDAATGVNTGIVVHRVPTATVYNRNTSLTDANMQVHRCLYQAAVRLADKDRAPDIVALPDLFCYPEATMLAGRFGVPMLNILLQDFRTLTAYDRGQHTVTNGVQADRPHLLALEEKVLAGAAHTVFISQALSDAIHGYYPRLPFAGSVVHLGVDAAEIAAIAAARDAADRLRLSLPPAARARRLVVACGRLVPVKGFDALLHAVALLPDLDIQLVIVGVGPEAAELNRLARVLGLRERVTFTGGIPRPDVLTWMSLADVAAVTSLWESFCYVCAEMMALGRPVIATAVDSLNELMPTEEFGYRIAVQGDPCSRTVVPEMLAAALAGALRNTADATARGAAARRRILTEFSNARFGERMSALCGELAGCQA